MHRTLVSLLALSISITTPLEAKTLYGLGISQSKAGEAFNNEQARAAATRFVSEQAKVGHFEYKKRGKGYEIKQYREVRLDKVEVKERISLPRDGVAVIVKADAEVPEYADAYCRKSKRFIKNAKQLNDIVGDMLNKTSLEIIKSKYKNRESLTGVAYMKDLSIRKARRKGQFILKAAICLADLH